jgi:hypothetical protein
VRVLAPALLLLVLAPGAGCGDGTPRILSTAVLADTHDTFGPYRVETVTLGVGSDDAVELRWSTAPSGGAFTRTPMGPDADLRAGEIPGQPAGTTVRYFTAVLRDDAIVTTDPPDAATFSGQTYAFHVLLSPP